MINQLYDNIKNVSEENKAHEQRLSQVNTKMLELRTNDMRMLEASEMEHK